RHPLDDRVVRGRGLRRRAGLFRIAARRTRHAVHFHAPGRGRPHGIGRFHRQDAAGEDRRLRQFRQPGQRNGGCRRCRALAKSRLQGYIAANVEGVAMTQDTGANRPVSPVLAGTTSNKDRTLLIADDDAAFRNRIARALELRGFIVTSGGSVAEALAQTARPPAFAVLDLRLGDGNGLELVGPLRQARPDIRIIVLTGYGNIATAVAAVKEGAVDYLAKPADADAIEQALIAHGRK